MFHCVLLFLSIAFTQFSKVACAGITGVSASLAPQYVTGSQPTRLSISANFPATNGQDNIEIVFDKELFSGDGDVVCTLAPAKDNACSVAVAPNETKITIDPATGHDLVSGVYSIAVELNASALVPLAFANLPDPGLVKIAELTAGLNDALPSAVDVFYIVPKPTFALTPGGTPIIGTTLSLVEVVFTTPVDLTAGQMVKLTSTKSVFAPGDTSGVTLMAGGMGAISQAATTANQIMFSGANTVAMGTAITFQIGGAAHAPLPAAAGPVLMDLMAGSTLVGDDVDGFGTLSMFTAGDPITFYNDTKIKYWIPRGGLSTLVETPELKVLAGPLEGLTIDMQWFGQIIVRLADGRKLVDVTLAKPSARGNRTLHRPGYFNQLEVRMFGNALPERRLKGERLWAAAGGQARVGFGTRRLDRSRNHGGLLAEYVHVESASISFVIIASHAGTEYPNDLQLQSDYTHLDWIALDTQGEPSFTGILPELWGIQPISDEVKAMLVPPSEAITAPSTERVCTTMSCSLQVS